MAGSDLNRFSMLNSTKFIFHNWKKPTRIGGISCKTRADALNMAKRVEGTDGTVTALPYRATDKVVC